MKNIFIINPTAGKKDISLSLVDEIQKADKNAIIHITSKHKDATFFVEDFCQKNQNEELRFFACGGDGTLNEVINGMIAFSNVSVGCYPSGSGNDFLKMFKEANFKDVNSLLSGDTKEVDLIKVNDSYCINVLNLGFDADVSFNMMKFKKKPIIGGAMAYNVAVLYTLFSKLNHSIEIKLDDEIFYDGEILLTAIANGLCYGGGYYCAPDALIDDGFLNICLVKKISRFNLLKLVSKYKKGQHINNPKLKNFLFYEKAKSIKIKSKKEISYAIDGEVFKTKNMDIILLPKKIKFIIPKS